MREFVNKYGVVVACVLIVVAGLILFFFRSTPPKGTTSKLSYFYDESTGKESVQPNTEVPPLNNAEGKPTVVEVVKISCEDGRNPRVGYYKKYAPDQQKRLIELAQLPRAANFGEFRGRELERQRLEATGLWIRRPDPKDSPWVPAASQEGAQIMSDANKCGENQTPIRVFP